MLERPVSKAIPRGRTVVIVGGKRATICAHRHCPDERCLGRVLPLGFKPAMPTERNSAACSLAPPRSPRRGDPADSSRRRAISSPSRRVSRRFPLRSSAEQIADRGARRARISSSSGRNLRYPAADRKAYWRSTEDVVDAEKVKISRTPGAPPHHRTVVRITSSASAE